MNFHVLTLFPEMITQGLSVSILGRAVQKGQISLEVVNIRDFSQDKHKKVDDYTYGGGAGMLMQAQPVFDAYCHVLSKMRTRQRPRVVYVTPQGRPFTQQAAKELAEETDLIFLCGHYEGVDERVLEELQVDSISIGDYVLTGGELPAMVMIDAIARLVPGVLHNGESSETESFENHLLEYPQYSRPEVWKGRAVPEVLLGGDHRKIAAWRLEEAKKRTRERRPDLYALYEKQEQAIERLQKKKLLHIPLIEALRRGNARLIYDGPEGVFLQEKNSGLYMMTAQNPEGCKKMLECLTKEDGRPDFFFACQRETADYLAKTFELTAVNACYQFVYTKKEALPIERKIRQEYLFRQLTEEDAQVVCAYYRIGGNIKEANAYVYNRIRAGAMLGIFRRREDGAKEEMAGFAGMHDDGSQGMLEILPRYRRQGLAAALEAELINRFLLKGWTPYGHVFEDNEASLQLQQKLGLCAAKELVYWMS